MPKSPEESRQHSNTSLMDNLIGSFSAQGQPISNTSSTASHLREGAYEVVFSQPFEAVPAVVVSPQTDNQGTGYVVSVSLSNVTRAGFSVFFQNLGSPATNKDVAFSFFAGLCN